MGVYDSGSGSQADYLSHIMEEHIHSVQRVYPSLANAIQLVGGSTAWALGAFVQVVPANAITDAFDVHYINTSNASAADNYQIELYAGSSGAEVLIAQTRIVRPLGVTQSIPMPIVTPVQLPNARISARLASASGGGDTLDISIFYHTY